METGYDKFFDQVAEEFAETADAAQIPEGTWVGRVEFAKIEPMTFKDGREARRFTFGVRLTGENMDGHGIAWVSHMVAPLSSDASEGIKTANRISMSQLKSAFRATGLATADELKDRDTLANCASNIQAAVGAYVKVRVKYGKLDDRGYVRNNSSILDAASDPHTTDNVPF